MIKTKRNRKCKIPHIVLERRTLCFSSYENRKLKGKLWVGAHERRRGHFCTVYFVLYFILDFISFTYQKALLPTLLLLVFKIVESLQYIIKEAFETKKKRSFKKTLNSGSPNTEPCGTPVVILSHSLTAFFTLNLSFLFVE